jgi:hypothetical protein
MGKSSSKPLTIGSKATQAILQDNVDEFDSIVVNHPFLVVKPVNDNLWTPLMLASINGSFNIVKHLVEDFRVSLDEQDYNGFTALIHLVYAGNPGNFDIAEYLCEKGADLLKKTDSGITAHSMALTNNNKRYVGLIEHHLKYGVWARHPFQTRKKLLWVYDKSPYQKLPIHLIKEICMYM